jgi:GAF domain-containing protein
MVTDGEFELPTWAALPARPHPEFDALAWTVAESLSVPIALVVLVSKGGQVFPGAVGLAPGLDARRSAPLNQSLSRRVAVTGRPLVLSDALADEEIREHHVVRHLGLRAYAGVPLLDGAGHPLGVLCAVDTEPREWSEADLQVLVRVADQGSRQLQLLSLELAEQESRAACERAALAAEQAARAAQATFEEAESEADRARVVARLGMALLSAETVEDVLQTVDRLVRSPLGAMAAVLGVAEAGSPLLQAYLIGPSTAAGAQVRLQVDDEHPLAVAVRERRLVTAATRAEADRVFPGVRLLTAPPAESVLALPLTLGQHASSGALMLAWSERRELDPALRTVAADLARQLGHTLDRVLLAAARQRLERSLPAAAAG